MRMARCTVNEDGDLVLTVSGTDIRQVYTWDSDPLLYPTVPLNGLGYRLIELGWMPDRRRMYGTPGMSPVAKLAVVALAGWTQHGEGEWTIPCYPRDED